MDVRISTDVVSKCAVVLRLVVHGKRLGSHRRCSERLKCEGAATSLPGVLPEERCKVGSADDDGCGVYVGHERCGGRSWRRDTCQHDCEGVTQRCFRWFWKEQRLRVRVLVLRERVMANIRMSQDAEVPQHGTVEGFEDGRQQRKEREKAQVQMSRVRQVWLGHECQGSASAFEASKRGLAETTYVDMARVDLNTLEIGSLSLPERNREFQSGIGSYAAMMVFALLGVKSCKSCLDLSARKVIGKLRDVSFSYANLRMAVTCTVSMAVSETSHMSHDVFFPCCCKGTECSAQCSDDWPERQSGLYSVSELSRSRT